MSTYRTNLELVGKFITRKGNQFEIKQPSFWLNDVTQANGTKRIEVAFKSIANHIKLRQEVNNLCTVFQVDGNDGVFEKNGLPVEDITMFSFFEGRANDVKSVKTPGDCDCLIISKEWHFLEFKTDATSNNIQQANDNREKGEAQLAKSMSSFRARIKDDIIRYNCVLVVPPSFPKFKASMVNRSLKFLKKFDAPLYEVSTSGIECYDLI